MDADDSARVDMLYRQYMEASAKDRFVRYPWIIMEHLVDVVLCYVPGPIVEIGQGASTTILAGVAMKHGVPFFTCDVDTGRCDLTEKNIKYDRMTVFKGRSTTFMGQYTEGASIVFIDGDHRYKMLKKEVDFFLPKVPPGGMMFLHDTCPVQFRYEKNRLNGRVMDTHLVRKELEQRDDVDVMTWRYTAAGCGLTAVLKKDMAEPDYRR